MTTLIGIIQQDGMVKVGKKLFLLPFRGTDSEGYPEVLIDAKEVGGEGWMERQSIKPYIGMKVEFEACQNEDYGYGYKILKKDNPQPK